MSSARRRGSGSPGGHIEVDLGERSYSICIGEDTLAQAGPEIARCTGASQVALVTEPGIGRRYAPRLVRGLRAAGLRVHRFDVPDGDATKNLRQVARLYEGFLAKGLDRSSAVVALGGGMVGDLAGFAAATYLRGIPVVQVPTTVLAMVDASIGGKTGVNLRQGKNLVGAFHQPRLVWIDTACLRSLARRHRVAGMAEVIKSGAIWDEELFGWIERDLDAILALESEPLLAVLERACAIKAEVVSRDEREGGLRRLLNFGHTLGHAVEKLTGFRRVLHGEAVAIGMVFAAGLSEDLGLAPAGTRERLAEVITHAGLPSEFPSFARKAYLDALRVDKKKVDRRIHFVVLSRIGRAETVALTPAEILPPARRPRRGRR